MELFLNIIVVLFDILYYSLFMKFSRKEGKLYRYLILFVLATLLVLLVNSNSLLAYLLFVLFTYVGLKYIVKLKVSLYDMLIIFIMLLCKILIETPIFMIFRSFLNIYFIGLIYSVIKIVLLNLLKNKMNKAYKFLKIKWDKNNFYIRYIFSILVFIYTIISSVFIILYYM